MRIREWNRRGKDNRVSPLVSKTAADPFSDDIMIARRVRSGLPLDMACWESVAAPSSNSAMMNPMPCINTLGKGLTDDIHEIKVIADFNPECGRHRPPCAQYEYVEWDHDIKVIADFNPECGRHRPPCAQYEYVEWVHLFRSESSQNSGTVQPSSLLQGFSAD
ncbi:hypothetical protein LZ31DRAFT_196833 [Colletotrichum somersetense]|nr:hypothetical protein LZ31DRAFT_196833 [Colletotrichum somersetense]